MIYWIPIFIIGLWVAMDGLVSMTYFAWVDKTWNNIPDQAVRVVRATCGIALIVLGLMMR